MNFIIIVIFQSLTLINNIAISYINKNTTETNRCDWSINCSSMSRIQTYDILHCWRYTIQEAQRTVPQTFILLLCREGGMKNKLKLLFMLQDIQRKFYLSYRDLWAWIKWTKPAVFWMFKAYFSLQIYYDFCKVMSWRDLCLSCYIFT